MQGKEHMNLQALDPNLGPVLLSIKDISCQEGSKVCFNIYTFVKIIIQCDI